jgi:hypothetical protein
MQQINISKTATHGSERKCDQKGIETEHIHGSNAVVFPTVAVAL